MDFTKIAVKELNEEEKLEELDYNEYESEFEESVSESFSEDSSNEEFVINLKESKYEKMSE